LRDTELGRRYGKPNLGMSRPDRDLRFEGPGWNVGEKEAREATGLTRLAEVSSINHDPCYHELYCLSSTVIVLVFSGLTSFVRKILQREENKGVEFTGGGRRGLHLSPL
jgi:hypothetical protein